MKSLENIIKNLADDTARASATAGDAADHLVRLATSKLR